MDLSDPTIQDINRPPRRDLDIEAEELHLASRSSTGPTSQDRQPDQLDLPTRTLRTRTAPKSDTREGCFVQHARKPHGRVRNKKLPIKPIVSRRLVEEDNRQDDVESACDGLDVLRADDCVTDTLLDDLCAAEKHSKTFCSSTVRISLSSSQADDNTIAALSSLVISIRKQPCLEVPYPKQLRRQFRLYYDMLLPDCPLELKTTLQYGPE